jgi:hypothetical protein
MFVVVTSTHKMGSNDLVKKPVAASMAAAATLSLFGGSFPTSRRASAKIAPQQFAPLLSPRLCQVGGASRVCRRLMWRKSRNLVAVLVLAAAHFGDNFALCANLFHIRLSHLLHIST